MILVPGQHDNPPAQSQGQIPALDGVRGLAVGLMVWFHLRINQLPGGWVSMSLFFPLSGFLITRLMLLERDRSGTVALGQFWRRRARRLIPTHFALLVIVSMVLIMCGTWLRAERGAVMSSMLYSNNWWQIGHSVDYWSRFSGKLSPFEHLWSLSVEEQFYIVWPLLTVAAIKWARRPLAVLAALSCGLAAAGATYGVVIAWQGWGGSTDIYYNTGVRAAELLPGAALAVLFAARPNVCNSERARRLLDIAAGGCLIAILFASLALDKAGPRFIADGGMSLVGFASVVIIAAAVRGGMVSSLLSLPLLRWLGTRCYSLYLWHWPIVALVTPVSSGLSGWWLVALQLALILSATVLSYWLIEYPLRRQRAAQMTTAANAHQALAS